MKKGIYRTLAAAFLLGVPLVLLGAREASAGVRLDIRIGALPFAVFHSNPAVAVIPGTDVYSVPDGGSSILFYNGCWYRPHQGFWYRGSSSHGPWVRLAPRSVPHQLTKVPAHYRSLPSSRKRVPYGRLERNRNEWRHQASWVKGRGQRERQDGHRERVRTNPERGYGRQGGFKGGRGNR